MLAVVDHPGAEDLDDLTLNVLAVSPDEKLGETEHIQDSFVVVSLGEVVAQAATGTTRQERRWFVHCTAHTTPNVAPHEK